MQKQEAQFKAAELEFHEQQLQHVSEEQRQAEELIQNSLDSGGWNACLLCHLGTTTNIVIVKLFVTLVIVAGLPGICMSVVPTSSTHTPKFCFKHAALHKVSSA